MGWCSEKNGSTYPGTQIYCNQNDIPEEFILNGRKVKVACLLSYG
ncbi:hypothetical protein [Ammoniphilus resinae]|uniref:Uncharacterized protein n=1 Tax=Ammoniphilus resinae TaxID=861532 RepID=A0ABS4GWE6_9BACL|nr:hypothetical protein [Ammoniphilus resinae]MBP1934422.1 hypothetical protein [Ammoniphilus resinae]